jgi:hypothetical protein
VVVEEKGRKRRVRKLGILVAMRSTKTAKRSVRGENMKGRLPTFESLDLVFLDASRACVV